MKYLTSATRCSLVIAVCFGLQIVSASAQTLRVTSPVGGENLAAGSVHQITWTRSNLNSSGTLYLYYSYNGSWIQIAGVAPGATAYSWTVPHTPTTSPGVWIGNWVNGAWQVYDQSDRPFTIVSSGGATSALQVKSPNGAENWAAGSVRQIAWTSSNLSSSGTLYLFYFYNGSWVQIASVAPDVTAYSWSVPNTPTTSPGVWIGNWVNGAWQVYDQSDQPFTIFSDRCGDERDAMINEYRTYGVPWTPGIPGSVPTCSDFAAGGGTSHFTWPELNRSPGSGHPPWGIVKQVLWDGLARTRSEYGMGINLGIAITSGYRCPHGHEEVYRQLGLPVFTTSRHQYGEAVDMKSTDRPWTQDEWIRLRNAALKAGATWTEPYEDAPGHVHAEWQY